MKILVTGATGFIGAHCVSALLKAGIEVRAMVRSEAKFANICKVHGMQATEIALGDVTDKQAVEKALAGCDGVIHTAAFVSTLKKDADKVFQTNVQGTEHVLGTAFDMGLKHIYHLSSITALYQPDARLLNGDMLAEGESETPYGKSKAKAEAYVRELQAQGCPVNITYPAGVIGPYDFTLTEPHQGIVMFLTKAAILTTTGIQFVDVRDVADTHVAMIQKKCKGQRVPLGGHYYTWRSLARMLENITGRYLPKVYVPAKALGWVGKAADMMGRFGAESLVSVINSESVQYATNWVCTDDDFFFNTLKMEYREARQTMEDAVYSLWQMGFIEKKHAGLLAAKRR